jgi:hypothetical protein
MVRSWVGSCREYVFSREKLVLVQISCGRSHPPRRTCGPSKCDDAYSSAATAATKPASPPATVNEPAPLFELGASVALAVELELLLEVRLADDLEEVALLVSLELSELVALVMVESVLSVDAEPVRVVAEPEVAVAPPVGSEAVPSAPATVKAGA